MDDVAATGAEIVVSANPGCLMQLDWGRRRAGVTVAVKHVVTLLDESLEPESGPDSAGREDAPSESMP
jgi:glycolate oxidase iron-sulfur subunit